MNPFLYTSTDTSTISINGKSPDFFGDVSLYLSTLKDIQLENVLDGQAICFDGSSNTWQNKAISTGSGIVNLKDLGDCSISGMPLQNQTLLFSNNKWTNSLMSHTNLLNIGINTHVQIDTHINSSGAVHGVISQLVGISDFQTLTNKILDSTTNLITCDKLRTSTGTVLINTSPAPTINQSLLATSSTNASWQTINHTNLLNIGTNTHSQIDYSLGLLNLSTGTIRSIVLSQNQTLLMNYVDGTDNNIIFVDNSSASIISSVGSLNGQYIAQYTVNGIFLNYNGNIDFSGTDSTLFRRYNIRFSDNIEFLSINWAFQSVTNGNNIMCEFYGSNNSNDYNDIMDYPVASSTLIFLGQTLLSSISGYFIINNTTPFLYLVINVHVNQTGFINSSFCSGSGNNQGFYFSCQPYYEKILKCPIDFTISTDSQTGNPLITYLDSNSLNLIINESTLSLYELYRRIFPVVRDKNTLMLTDGSHSATLTSTSLSYNLEQINNVSVSNVVDGQYLIYNQALNKWNNKTVTGITLKLENLVDCQIITPNTAQVLMYASDNLWYNATLALFSNCIVDVKISNNVSTNQILMYNGSQWINSNNSMSNLLDCTITTPINNDVLRYNGTTWSNQQIALQTLSDVQISNVQANQLIIYNGSKWINTNTLIDSSVIFKNVTDPTKQFYFSSAGSSPNTTHRLMIPDADCILVGDANIQTITNKTLDSTTNLITCDKLRTSTGTVLINTSTAPTINQSLLATSSTNASWQTINHLNLSNIGIYTHPQIDTHLSSNSGIHGISGAVVGTTDTQTLYNKTITDPSNNVVSNYLRSSTATVYIAGNSPATGQMLIANSNSSATWQTLNLVSSLGTLSDVQISNAQTNQLLVYNGSKWNNNSFSNIPFVVNYSEILITWFPMAGFSSYVQVMQINPKYSITTINMNNGASNQYTQVIKLPDVNTLVDQQTFYIVCVGTINAMTYFYPYDNTGEFFNIINTSNMSLVLDNTQLTQTTYKFVYYQNLSRQVFMMTDLGTINVPLPNIYNTFVFNCSSSFSGTFTYSTSGYYIQGQTLRIIDKYGLFGSNKIQICMGGNNTIEGLQIKVYSTNWLCREFMYIGNDSSGNNGNFYCISSSVVN